jgi:8-oxo-dGTP pyrophosphatase MutT (NUDIX family)
MIVCDIAGIRFNYRVAGVFAEDGHVFLHRFADADYWFLPGGRVEAGEASEEALRREMREELGVTISVGRLLWVVENFFAFETTPFHELGFYYEAALPSGTRFSDKSVVHTSADDLGREVLFRWFPLWALDSVSLVPPFLLKGLLDRPRHTRHLIDRR